VFGEVLRKRQFPHTYLTALISSPSNIPTTLFKENAIPSEANAWSGQNYGGYRNAEMEQVFDDLASKCDAYKETWARMQKVYSETLPMIPLFWRINTQVTPKWLHGLKQTGHQFATSHWVEDWTAD
jgi:peptide/nickel transport system substrate-binding protein